MLRAAELPREQRNAPRLITSQAFKFIRERMLNSRPVPAAIEDGERLYGGDEFINREPEPLSASTAAPEESRDAAAFKGRRSCLGSPTAFPLAASLR
jgi:hypothetical protein